MEGQNKGEHQIVNEQNANHNNNQQNNNYNKNNNMNNNMNNQMMMQNNMNNQMMMQNNMGYGGMYQARNQMMMSACKFLLNLILSQRFCRSNEILY